RLRVGTRQRRAVLAPVVAQQVDGGDQQAGTKAEQQHGPTGNAAAAVAPGLVLLALACHHMLSGAETPRRPRPLASTCRVAAARPSRALRSSSSAVRMGRAL